MVKSVIVYNLKKVKMAVPRIEEKIKVKISFYKNNIGIKGNEYNEYIAEMIIRAVDFGFDVEDALLLLDEHFVLEFIDIKDHTRRKNIKDVRARVIGRKGKAMRTIENLTGGVIVLNDNELGVIVDSEHLDTAIQSIISIIHGSKHGNVFSYLDKNKGRGEFMLSEDLGLTETAKSIWKKEGVKIADKILKKEGIKNKK